MEPGDLTIEKARLAFGLMAGLALAGGIGGAILGARGKSRTWLAAGTGAGILVGGGVGFYMGRALIQRTELAKKEIPEKAS